MCSSHALEVIQPLVIKGYNKYKFVAHTPSDDLITTYCRGTAYGYAYETYRCEPHDFIVALTRVAVSLVVLYVSFMKFVVLTPSMLWCLL